MERTRYSFVLFLMLALATEYLAPQESQAQVFKTQPRALEEAFAGSDTVVRKTLFLTESQVEAIEKRARSKLTSRIFTYYEAISNSETTGFAFFETSIIRTKPATIMVIVNPDGSIRTSEILAFYEPTDYLPTPNWFELFEGKTLSAALWPGRDIHTISGATLTARALTFNARRALAIYELVISKEQVN